MSGARTPEGAAELAARLTRPEIAALSPYHVQDAAGLIKLDAMENPFALPQAEAAALGAHLAGVALNRYPDGAGTEVIGALRRRFAIPEGSGVLLGNGSDELLLLLMMVFAGPGRGVLVPTPTFSMYRVMARMTGSAFTEVPLASPSFELDLPAMLAAIEDAQPSVVILACPNNPTGVEYPAEALHAVIEAAPGLVVVDEAYAPFAARTILPEIARYPNVLCLRTLSKMGLAGIRLGFLVADSHLTEALDRARLPYNINSLSQATASWLLEHYAVLADQIETIIAERAALVLALETLEGVRSWPSGTNFLLLETPLGGDEVAAELRTRGILIKSMQQADPRLARCIRVTVGTRSENEALLVALKEVLRAKPA